MEKFKGQVFVDSHFFIDSEGCNVGLRLYLPTDEGENLHLSEKFIGAQSLFGELLSVG